MQMFRVTQEIDYSTADPSGLFGATSVQMFRVHSSGLPQGVGSQNFRVFSGQLLLTIDMIVDMGGRPLVLPDGMDDRVLGDRERLLAEADKVLRESGQD